MYTLHAAFNVYCSKVKIILYMPMFVFGRSLIDTLGKNKVSDIHTTLMTLCYHLFALRRARLDLEMTPCV